MAKKETLGSRMHKIMKAKGLTRAEVARRSEIDPSYVSQILKGETRRSLGIDVICRLANALGEDPKEVFRLAAGLPREVEGEWPGVPEPKASEFLELMRNLLHEPEFLSVLEELVAMPREKRLLLLKAVKKVTGADKRPARGSRTS